MTLFPHKLGGDASPQRSHKHISEARAELAPHACKGKDPTVLTFRNCSWRRSKRPGLFSRVSSPRTRPVKPRVHPSTWNFSSKGRPFGPGNPKFYVANSLILSASAETRGSFSTRGSSNRAVYSTMISLFSPRESWHQMLTKAPLPC